VPAARSKRYPASKKRNKPSLFARAPLAVKVGLLLLGALVAHVAWLNHHNTIKKEDFQRNRKEQARLVQQDVNKAVGGILTADAVIINAHENSFSLEDENEAAAEFNRLQVEWDRTEDGLEVRLKDSFPQQDVWARWNSIVGELRGLDKKALALHQLSATARSHEHTQRLAQAKQQLATAQKALDDFNVLLTQDTPQ
jgi:hypothetical protein